MKITIEHEKFTATTDDFNIARQLCQMAGLIDAESTPGAIIINDLPADKSTPEQHKKIATALKSRLTKPATPPPTDETEDAETLPPFDPAWTEHDVDLDKNYLEQYSNPCSTLCGQCGDACVQTELWLRDKSTGKLSVCDVEFYTRDDLRATLEPYIALAKRKLAARVAKNLPCSMERLKQIAEMYNAGQSDDEIMERLHLSANSIKTYRNAAKRVGLLNA